MARYIAEADNPERSLISRKPIGDLFHACQKRFGCCIGRLNSPDFANPIWRFAKCSGKWEDCKTQIVNVTVYQGE